VSETEGDLYDQLVNDSYRLCRRVRTAAYWVGWVAIVIAVVSAVLVVLTLWPESGELDGDSYFGSGSTTLLESPFRYRLQAALQLLPGTLGWAALVGVLAAGLRLMARRLEIDLVTEYSADDE